MKKFSKKEYDRQYGQDKRYVDKSTKMKIQKKKDPYKRKDKYKNIEEV